MRRDQAVFGTFARCVQVSQHDNVTVQGFDDLYKELDVVLATGCVQASGDGYAGEGPGLQAGDTGVHVHEPGPFARDLYRDHLDRIGIRGPCMPGDRLKGVATQEAHAFRIRSQTELLIGIGVLQMCLDARDVSLLEFLQGDNVR